jgi:hypothetical protein
MLPAASTTSVAGAHVLFALLPADEHATTAQRARGIALEQEPRDSRLRPGLEVGSRRTARVQEARAVFQRQPLRWFTSK